MHFLRRGKEEGWKDDLKRDKEKNIETRQFLVMNKYGYKLENHKGEK